VDLTCYRKVISTLTVLQTYFQKAIIKEEYRITFVSLNILSNDEHVPEVKHHMKTVGERTRPVFNVRNFSTQMAVEFYIR